MPKTLNHREKQIRISFPEPRTATTRSPRHPRETHNCSAGFRTGSCCSPSLFRGDPRGAGVNDRAPAGVPIPLNGVNWPDGGTGMSMSSGLGGTIFGGRFGILMRFASLL